MAIELIYWILFSMIAVITILTSTRKMSLGIGIVGILLGLGIVYVFSPYMNIVIQSVGTAVFYGGAYTLPVMLAIGHIISLMAIVVVAMYNLVASGGKIIWA